LRKFLKDERETWTPRLAVLMHKTAMHQIFRPSGITCGKGGQSQGFGFGGLNFRLKLNHQLDN